MDVWMTWAANVLVVVFLALTLISIIRLYRLAGGKHQIVAAIGVGFALLLRLSVVYEISTGIALLPDRELFVVVWAALAMAFWDLHHTAEGILVRKLPNVHRDKSDKK